MAMYGFEHLKFSSHTYKQRTLLLIVGCISILVFEYNIANNLKFYEIEIPNHLIRIGLLLIGIWTTIQFFFSSLDDFTEWRKNFLIDPKIKSGGAFDSRSMLVEISSFSKGQIKYIPQFGLTFGGDTPAVLGLKEAEAAFKHALDGIAAQMKVDVMRIESFQRWYKGYGWTMITRFAVLEFGLPLLFIIYALLICRWLPILPK